MLSAWPPAPSSTNDSVGPPDWDQAPVVPSSKSTELTTTGSAARAAGAVAEPSAGAVPGAGGSRAGLRERRAVVSSVRSSRRTGRFRKFRPGCECCDQGFAKVAAAVKPQRALRSRDTGSAGSKVSRTAGVPHGEPALGVTGRRAGDQRESKACGDCDGGNEPSADWHDVPDREAGLAHPCSGGHVVLPLTLWRSGPVSIAGGASQSRPSARGDDDPLACSSELSSFVITRSGPGCHTRVAMTSRAPALDPLIGRDADVAQAGSDGFIVAADHAHGGRRIGQVAPRRCGHRRAQRGRPCRLLRRLLRRPRLSGRRHHDRGSARRGADAGADSEEAVLRALRAGPTVLAVDNLEQVAGAGALLVRFLQSAGMLTIIATSRTPLGVRGEVEFAVRPLPLPEDRTKIAVEASASGALFLTRARELRPDLDLDESTASDVALLLAQLDGLPLAIELAAARTRAASPGEILRRLESRGIDAIDGQPGDEHRSLAVILEWTLLQLPQRDVAVLEAVAVCAGFDLEFVDAIVPGGRGVELIESLLALGLVRRAGTIGGVSRFTLLETIPKQRAARDVAGSSDGGPTTSRRPHPRPRRSLGASRGGDVAA